MSATLGRFDPNVGTKSIELGPRANHPVFVAAHEVGHFIDYEGHNTIGVGFGSHGDPDTAPIMKAIAKTKEAQKVAREARAAGPGAVGNNFRELNLPHEFFARAYAQYIATKSQHPALLGGLNAARGAWKADHHQWQDESFKPISAAFDVFFAKKGWAP